MNSFQRLIQQLSSNSTAIYSLMKHILEYFRPKMASEITGERDEEPSCIIDAETRELNIRRIIEYQKSLYCSSSSSSSFSTVGASFSFSSPRKSSSFLDLIKEGSTSLRRLFDKEHKSLENYLKDYSGSPIIKRILLWGSDTDDGVRHDDPWMCIKQAGAMVDYGSESQSGMALEDSITNNNSQPE